MPAEIRPAGRDDLDAIEQIERAANPHPWSRASIESSLDDALGVCLVAVDDGAIAGFVLARAVLDEAEVLEIAVAPAHRRRGLARDLLRALDAVLAAQGVATLHLEVRRANAGARALYDAVGFEVSGERRGYYSEPPDDAVLMSRAVPRADL